jgi:hypothetical protein
MTNGLPQTVSRDLMHLACVMVLTLQGDIR